jgi:hypothetical protein
MSERPRPQREANQLTLLLDKVLGEDRFDRHPVDIRALALEYSQRIDPKSPISSIEERDLQGCMGALVYSEDKPRQWGIAYHRGQSPGRRNFTLGHEFGHYILHRDLIETDPRFKNGIYCDEQSILQRDGEGIEKEADTFAATLLMPLHDFRRELPADTRADFEILGKMANRYGVSLTAAILRWLEYTETRVVVVVSNEGFAHWARSTGPAFKSGRYVRTKNVVFELPSRALAVKREYSDETKSGIAQPSGAWGFPEPLTEMCIRSDRYDQEITLLHFEGRSAVHHLDDEPARDSYDQFLSQERTR